MRKGKWPPISGRAGAPTRFREAARATRAMVRIHVHARSQPLSYWTLPNRRSPARAPRLRLASSALLPRDAGAQPHSTHGSRRAHTLTCGRACAQGKVRRLRRASPASSAWLRHRSLDRRDAVGWASPRVDAHAPMLRSSRDLGDKLACTGSSSSFWRPRALAARLRLLRFSSSEPAPEMRAR